MSSKKLSPFKKLRQNQTMFTNLISMAIIWTCSSFCYYLISYQLKYLQGNIYINSLISSSSEIVAYLTSGIMISCLGMKKTLLFSYMIALAGILALIFYKTESQILLPIFILGCKYGVS